MVGICKPHFSNVWKIFGAVAAVLFATTLFCQGELPRDDAYNRRIMANEVFHKADKTHDYRLSPEDGEAWEEYGELDANGSGQVDFDEFVAGAELPYPEWNGTVTRNVVYKRAGNEVLLMDIYAPRKPGDDPAPVCYYTHGGGWSGGRKEPKDSVQPLFEALTDQGFACVSVSYRLVKMWNPNDDVRMRDCIVDCRDGLRFLKKHEEELGLDMNRVVVFGSSAGGHIAQLLTFSGADDFIGDPELEPYKVSPVAGISWFGPSDFRDKNLAECDDGTAQKFKADHWARLITKNESFDYPNENPETQQITRELSPVWWLKKESAPLLHIHGDQDVTILPKNAAHLQAAAEACGADVTVQMVKGAGHGWWAKDIEPDKQSILNQTVEFAIEHTMPAVTVAVDATKEIVTVNRANLMGVNIAVYNPQDDLQAAIDGPLCDLDVGLVRIPGGSISDRYYWNGNGIIETGTADPAKFKEPFWQVDYSAYKPGFVFDVRDWSDIDYHVTHIDAKTMHEVTCSHPVARNLVTVNAGSGTPEMAAEWVRWANIENGWDVKYWEIGNELNGEWEAGHIRPDGSVMTAEKYAEIFTAYAKAMKAVDPTIKVGGPSCDIRHHEDYFEPLLKLAGEHVDFLTLHFYSLRSSLAPENELFDGLENLKPVTDRLDELVKTYQPERLGEIEYSITEWNSKLPKDQDAFRLFNGLWFASWIGEMIECGIDSATVWDLFSGDDNGHGLLVHQGDRYVPTGRYWGFWLWSHCMADILIESSVNSDLLHVHATRDADNVYVMIMNESRTESFPVVLNLNGFEAVSGTETTLSSREYFWNPFTRQAEWNSGPVSKPWKPSDQVVIPPYCVKVYQFSKTTQEAKDPQPSGEAELKILLPDSGFGDLDVEGWVRAFAKGTDQPFGIDLGAVNITASSGATVEQIEPQLSGATAKFILKPSGSGPVTVTATCNGLTAQQTVDFKPVVFEEQITWTFDEMPARSESRLQTTIENGKLAIRLENEAVAPPNNHIFAIKEYPKPVPKERIGGVLFDLAVSKDWKPEGTKLQVILQSHGAYWIPCGDVVLKPGDAQTVKLEIPDKQFLNVMDQGFAVLFLLAAGQEVSGTVELDNLGFLLRPEQ